MEIRISSEEAEAARPDLRTPGEILEIISGKIEELEVALLHLPERDVASLSATVKSSLRGCLNHLGSVVLTAEELIAEQGE